MTSSFKAKQSLGQNFLMHARIAERIARASGITGEDTVLEIGPGTGMLTKELLKLAKHVVAIEADHELYERLSVELEAEIVAGKLSLVSADIRAFDLATLPERYALVANIPYYLTGEIFKMFLSASHQPHSMTLLVQKEVAERIARSKKESILSLSIKAYGLPAYEFTVPRGAFMPAPNVDSAVISIRSISRTHFRDAAEEHRFFELIRAGFAHKRKFVRSNLTLAGFDAGEIPEKARAEDLSLEDWLTLTRAI
jgi:16S rRNA (adenine1518-N6/adenine1519-N6)-dimethyltransferase